MIFFLYFSMYAFLVRKTKSIALPLSLMLAFSAFCGILIGKTPPVDNFRDLFNIFYTILILTIFISAFIKYRLLTEIVSIDNVKMKKVTIVLITAGIISFVINAYLFYKMITSDFNNYEDLKNGGLCYEFAYSLPINHVFISLASFLAPVSYLLLGFGFYYAYLKNGKISAICFLLSLNMPLLGFTMLSRSSSLAYFYLLMMYFLYSMNLYSRQLRKRIFLLLLVLFLPTAIYFYVVTENRFKNYETPTQSTVHNPLMYSIFDYNSQWTENGIIVMSKYYSIEAIQFGNSTNTLIPFIYNLMERFIFGIEHVVEEGLPKRAKIWPVPYTTSFNGLVAELVFDFGYFFALMFSLIYAYITQTLAPQANKTAVSSYICFGLVVTIPMLSMYGNWFASLHYNLAILYSLITYYYLKYRIKIFYASSVIEAKR